VPLSALRTQYVEAGAIAVSNHHARRCESGQGDAGKGSASSITSGGGSSAASRDATHATLWGNTSGSEQRGCHHQPSPAAMSDFVIAGFENTY
jgi:hypothetical protein